MTEQDKPAGAKGQQHYDVPAVDNVTRLFDRPSGYGKFVGADLTHTVHTIGQPTLASEIPFAVRKSGRAHIKLQNIFSTKNMRPPAWTSAAGPWPVPSDATTLDGVEAEAIAQKGLVIYIVKTTDEEYFAGFTTGDSDSGQWPDVVKDLLPVAARISTGSKGRTGLIDMHSSAQRHEAFSPLAQKVLDALARNKNVLLYGPAGTGKTHALNQVRLFLERAGSLPEIELDDSSMAAPFVSTETDSMVPTPSRVEFVTFHQDFGYEDFVMGLRPVPGMSLQLKPFAGILLDCAMSVSSPDEAAQSAVIMIDEMNRGNVPKILGDFLTFMDDAYREGPDGEPRNAIPVRLAKIQSSDNDAGIHETEPIGRLRGEATPLPVPWYFPHHMYVLATMNSVDKSVAPLDSAIGRRFERIDAFPNISELAEHFEITVERQEEILGTKSFPNSPNVSPELNGESNDEDEDFVLDDEEQEAGDASHIQDGLGDSIGGGVDVLTPQELAIRLLKVLNDFIDENLGVDFELGHVYFWSVKNESDLIAAWDTMVWPQLRDRFGARPQELVRLFRVNQENKPVNYAFTVKRPGSKHVIIRQLSDLTIPDAMETLRFLAEQ